MGVRETWLPTTFIFEAIRRKCLFIWFLPLFFTFAGNALSQIGPDNGKVTSPASLIIPDGTPIQLRFAQSVWGMRAGGHSRRIHAQPGDFVRMVVAADVLIGGNVIVQKGSRGQATVKWVWMPSRNLYGVRDTCTCVSLDLNWVKGVDDQHIPLRSNAKGKPGEFEVQVHSTPAGTIASPLSFGAGMMHAMDSAFPLNMKELIHRRDWIPAGTRMTAYVQGDITMDAGEIREMQEGLPIPNETGLVMIYRTKGQKNIQPLIYCDSEAIGKLGSLEFVTLELEPGRHSCQAGQERALEFSVSGGQEYYLYLQHSSLKGEWRLSLVDRLEGEDAVGEAVPIRASRQGNDPH